MRRMKKLASALMILTSFQTIADDGGSSEGMESLTEYLKNLGSYLGYDVTTAPQNDPVATLLDISATTLAQQYAFVTELGALPVNDFTQALSYFVPSDNTNYALINDMANYAFQNQPNSGAYNSASTAQSGGISVSELIDQKTYQNDPVSQFVLNILGTPQTTYCLDSSVSNYKSDCAYLYDTKVMANVVGPLPDPYALFSYDYNQTVVPQLSVNTLLGPMMYTTEDSSSSTSSSDASNSSSDEGLTAQNQAQTAMNFIRYATGMVAPVTLPKLSDYSELYNKAISEDTSVVSAFDKQMAQEEIAKFIAKLRSYSAKSSISSSNLFYMLSKRMPQSQGSDDSQNSQKTSQALSEFQMATRRLYDPTKQDSGTQWVDQINTASDATVQKEIAILLSEINYQLYLSREIDERILATLSILGTAALTAPSFTNDASIEVQQSTENKDE